MTSTSSPSLAKGSIEPCDSTAEFEFASRTPAVAPSRPPPAHGPLGQLPAQLRLLPELRVPSDAGKSGMDAAAEIR